MAVPVDPRLSWTVRHRALRDAAGDRHQNELAEFVRELCAVAFPGNRGYLSSVSKLSGPIEGTTLALARGDFRALVSVQRYERVVPSVACGKVSETQELRLVACAGSQRIAEGERRAERALHRWRASGVTLGALLGCALAWALGVVLVWGPLWTLAPPWSISVLLLPAMLVGATLVAAGNVLGRQRAARILDGARVAARHDLALQTDLDRWMSVLEVLSSQRDALAEQSDGRPFRTPGSAARALTAERPRRVG